MVCWYNFSPHLTWHLNALVNDIKTRPLETLLRPDKAYVQSSDPFAPILVLCLWFIALTGLLGAVTQEFSWVDRIWSVAPPLYAWLFALHPYVALDTVWPTTVSECMTRPFLLAGLASLWGLRLTYNFWRKGGYAGGGEDYRWEEIRTWFSFSTLQLFNVVFIAFFQNILLFLLIAPAYLAWVGRTYHALTLVDVVLASLFLLLLLVETVADQQQWVFQRQKYQALFQRPSRKRRASLRATTAESPARPPKNPDTSIPLVTGDIADGFLQSGLFAFSRHPNFWAEMSLWWVFHLFAYPAAGIHLERRHDWNNFARWPFWANWTAVGPLLLTLLFQGSTSLTEELSARKYPQYRRYQKRVSRLLPWTPKARKD